MIVPAAFFKLSVQDICTFSFPLGNNEISQPLSLGVQFTFYRADAVTVSRTLKFSASLIAKVFAV